MACIALAGCRDSYPVPQAPLDRFYFPSGIGAHQLPSGKTALVVVSTNFDLRYDPQSGGTILSVDPDASDDTATDGVLAVLSTYNIGSFGGEVVVAEPGCPPGWPTCRFGCPTLAPALQAANVGAEVITSSRYNQAIYTLGLNDGGQLVCGPGCTIDLPVQVLDPYGVGLVCSTQAGLSLANAYVTQLRAANNQGILTRLDLKANGLFDTVVLASPNTYTSAFDPSGGRLFLSTQLGITQPLRWIEPLSLPAVTVNGLTSARVRQVDLAAYLRGALTQDMAVSNDGTRLYVQLEQIDADILYQAGAVVPKGGALAVFSLTPNGFNQPTMVLDRAVNSCLGGGQVRVLPPRPAGRRDLVAVTCDTQSTLVLYDDEAGQIVSVVGLNPATGAPLLGRGGFGLAVQPILASQRTVNSFAWTSSFCPNPQGSATCYPPSPCRLGGECVRLYVGSFEQSFVSILEVDPGSPSKLVLVKRIGIESAQ